MGLWDDRLLPRLLDRSLSASEVGELRAEACAGLSGRVLEIGFGSGLNLPHLPATVTWVGAVEPSDAAWALSTARRTAYAGVVERTGLDGQHLPVDDASVDAVLSTFTLCSLPDLAQGLSEVRRVLRPGGALHVLEHGLAPDAGVARWQQRLEPWQRRFVGGCHLTRDVPAALTDAGLVVERLRSAYLPGPSVSRPWTYVHLGRVVRS